MNRSDGQTPHLWQVSLGGAAACLLLTLVGYLLVVQPISATQRERAALRAELTELHRQESQVVGSRRAANDELVRVGDALKSSPVHLEPVERLNVRLARIVEVASESGMEIHETKAGDMVEGVWHHTVPVQVSGRGSFSSCARFLHELHDLLPDVEVLGFGLSSTPSDPRTQSSFRFDLAWYAATTVVTAERDGATD